MSAARRALARAPVRTTYAQTSGSATRPRCEAATPNFASAA